MEYDEIQDTPLTYTGDFFKYSTLGILFILILAQLINVLFDVKVIPEIISVGVAVVCIFYLWLAEGRDTEILRRTNMELFEAHQALKESHVDTILSLILSQEAKDSYTYGHSERVRQYSIVIAQEMNLPKEEIDTITRAAKLHDIGKIGIRDSVLFAQGDLTESQFDIIKSHPTKGVVILEPLKFLDKEKEIVRYHHERYDGEGYPDRIKGERIPLGARIICVADAFDAMRTQRPYNDTLSKQQVIDEFKHNSGIQFDPQVVNAFLKNIDRFYV